MKSPIGQAHRNRLVRGIERWRNLISLYLAQGVYSVAPLIVIPYLTRVLGPHNFGVLALFQSLIAYGVVVLNFGFYVSGIRDSARYREDAEKLGERIRAILITKCALLIIVIFAMGAAVALVPMLRCEWLLFSICGLQLIGNIALPTWLFQGLQESHKLLMPQIIGRLGAALLIFLFVKSRDEVWLAALFLSSADIVSGLILWGQVRQFVSFRGFGRLWPQIWVTLKDDFLLFAISVGSILYTAFNPLIIDIFWGPVWVAYYTISLRIATAATKITSPLVQAVSPKLAVLVTTDRRTALRLLLKSAMVLTVATGVVGITMLFFPGTVLRLVAGSEYVGAVPLLRILSPLALLMVIGALVGQNFAVHVGLENRIARSYWAIGIATIVVMVPTVDYFGAIGCATLVVLAESAVVAKIFFELWKRTANQHSQSRTC